MRAVIWFVLLFVVAVVAATTLGANDGLVSFYWSGQRVDLSLNLFLILLVIVCAALVTVFNTLNALIGLPQRVARGTPRPHCAGLAA
jgi:HemY protein